MSEPGANPSAEATATATASVTVRPAIAQPALLIGADGMLGRAWAELLDARRHRFEPSTIADLDLTDAHAVTARLDGRHRVIVNCTGWTDVDGAEQREADATAINGEAVERLARRAADTDALLVHYSTDYVFDGRGVSPYPTDHPAVPVNAYGRSKLAGEVAVRESGCRHLIVRTSWLYAAWAKNFVLTMVKLMAERDVVRVVHDQRGRPTSAEHLAATTLRLIERGATGVYHVTDGGECTWFEFARHIAQLVGAGCRVEPCTTGEFPRPAARPAYSVLDLSATEALLGPMPGWRSNLANVIEQVKGA